MAGLNFQAQENELISPDDVCTMKAGSAGYKTTQQSVQRTCFSCMKLIEYLMSLVHLIQVFMNKSYSSQI